MFVSRTPTNEGTSLADDSKEHEKNHSHGKQQDATCTTNVAGSVYRKGIHIQGAGLIATNMDGNEGRLAGRREGIRLVDPRAASPSPLE